MDSHSADTRSRAATNNTLKAVAVDCYDAKGNFIPDESGLRGIGKAVTNSRRWWAGRQGGGKNLNGYLSHLRRARTLILDSGAAVSCCAPILTGIGSSFLASILLLFCAQAVRRQRGKPFTGIYAFDKDGGGTVCIEHRDGFWQALTASTTVLTVHAKNKDGSEDWRGTVEAVGLSNIASGFYWHPNRAGGALRFALLGASDIVEHGTPHDTENDRPFVKLLKRQT